MISTASETDSDLSLSDFSDSSSDEDTPLPPPLQPERGRGIRTRGGRVRTRGGQQRPTNPRNNWLEWAAAPFTPVIPPFTSNPGPTITLSNDIKDYVHLFVSDKLIYDIVAQTNLYADEFLANAAPTAKSQSNEWKPVTNLEIQRYIALSILMGIIICHLYLIIGAQTYCFGIQSTTPS